jgi:hypothetical protein
MRRSASLRASSGAVSAPFDPRPLKIASCGCSGCPPRTGLKSCIVGRTRGLLGGLAGGFIGALVLAGMARTAASGDLPAFYSPGELASSALLMASVAAVLALVSPHAVGLAASAWAAGALLAALAVPWTDQGMYALACIVHVLAAVAVVCLAWWRAAGLEPRVARL